MQAPPALCIWYIQWNLRIKDKLVHGPLSTIRKLSFMGGLSKKAFNSVLVTFIYFMYSHSVPMIMISFQVWIMNIKKDNICQRQKYNVSMVTDTDLK